jgi:hypothetical protein
MKANISKTEFNISYPLYRKVVRDLKIITEKVGTLQVTGTGYNDTTVPNIDVFEKYSVDIDFVYWKGVDIKEVLDYTNALDEVEEYVIRQVARLFDQEKAA